jgi:hypothetical protein
VQKAKGIYNLKLLKLHGSTNWLLCPNCNRLYTGVGGEEEAWDLYVLPQDCPTCERAPRGTGRFHKPASPLLEPFLITPTYVKVFDNPHIRMTWHNAYMDLAEATEVVFVGYSLPEADYHLRTLLRRSIRPDASVVAVLTESDRLQVNTPESLHRFFSSTRYAQFFGEDRVSFHFGGVAEYFGGLIGQEPLQNRLNTLKRTVAGRVEAL